MKNRHFSIVAVLLFVIAVQGLLMGQSSRSSIKERAPRHLWFWAAHHSVISQDGTFIRLVRVPAPSEENAAITWKFQVVPLSGESHDLTLPGYPSHFAFGESDKLFVAIPDPQAWQNRESSKLPDGIKTKLYIISSPYDGSDFSSAVVVEIDGFAGSLRVRDVEGKVYAYLTVRNQTENPSQVAEENAWDHWLVVVDTEGNVKSTELTK